MGLPYDAGDTGFDDSGFLPGYLRQRRTQKLGVVHSYISDDRQDRCQYVGAVQPSSQPCFHHRYIHFLLCEIGKSHGGHCLKERRLYLIQKSPVLLYKTHHFVSGNRRAVDADAFRE